jgi:hypothetical protein
MQATGLPAQNAAYVSPWYGFTGIDSSIEEGDLICSEGLAEEATRGQKISELARCVPTNASLEKDFREK